MLHSTSSTVSISVGSWGAYAACNDKALGSQWLDLSYFNEWEEIEKELEQEGFDLDGEDAELFIQDIDGFPEVDEYTSPRQLFALLKESGCLESEYLMRCAVAFVDYFGFADFARLVDDRGFNWANSIIFYEGKTLLEVAEQVFFECYCEVPDYIAGYIDFDRFARDLSYDGYTETKYGVIYWAD